MERLHRKKIALTGASGNMGRETLLQLMQSEHVASVRVLLLEHRRERRFAAECIKKYGARFEFVFGNIDSLSDCLQLVDGCDYVLNIAAVIPPLSDRRSDLTRDCNIIGARNIVKAVEAQENQPKLIHISSVAVYGNRNHLHPWGRVGDPLLPSVYDYYAASKVIGERFVLESAIKQWAVVRQTAMLHMRMLTDNLKDGLMFHTCYNAPLEWLTARDSGRLMTKIVESDAQGKCDSFWKKVYNIGGGAPNRCTGFETFDDGFKIIGGSTEKFMRPHWNATRNFHGLWFADSDVLDKQFNYVTESINDYWQEILKRHPYYKIAKIIPSSIISKLAIGRLLSDKNSPSRWLLSEDDGRVYAFFGDKDSALSIARNWNDFPLLSKNRLPNGQPVDYNDIRDIKKIKERGFLFSHGYDETKPDSELTIDDMKSAAEFRGGKCISREMEKGDLYCKLEWECGDGHRFWASPYTVIKAGHWCPKCFHSNSWDYDRLAKSNPFYAQVWYDSHEKNENRFYYFDCKEKAKMIENGLENVKRAGKAVIYVFSGTGNTRRVAELYAAEFKRHGIATALYNISAGYKNMPSPDDFDYIGFAFPIYGFNAPEIMLEFAERFPFAHKDIFVFETSGEPLELNNVASLKFASVMEYKGYTMTNEYHYVMPYNMIFRHDDGMATIMYETAKSRVVNDVEEIVTRQPRALEKIPFGGLIAALFRIQYPAYRINGKHFQVEQSKCIGCYKCVRCCPENNIKLDDGNINFGSNCIMCARCSFNCPSDAIHIGLFENWKVNGAYNFEAEEIPQSGKHAKYCKNSYNKYFKRYYAKNKTAKNS